MDIIRLNATEPIPSVDEKEFSIAIGFFDGLHRGHQAVIEDAIQQAKLLGVLPAVMTFDPHPSRLFSKGEEKINYITSLQEKKRILDDMGIHTLFIVEFTKELASWSPEKFVNDILKDLNVRHVTAGFDFTFGAKGEGTMKQMRELGGDDFSTTVIQKITESQEKISSTRIRKLVKEGNVVETARLLGRPFRSSGIVVNGDKRGRLLGFPTANIVPDSDLIVPKNGVYAVRFIIDGEKFNGVCNIGVKPTFDKSDAPRKTIEVNVFDFQGDLYGKLCSVEWIQWIRDEQKFNSVDELVAQITDDKKTAEKILLEEI